MIRGAEQDKEYAFHAVDINVKRERRVVCRSHADHMLGSWLTWVVLDVLGFQFGPFVPCDMADFEMVVNETLARQLEDSGLQGAEVLKAARVMVNGETVDQPLYRVQYSGANALRPACISPPEANRCPFCGHAPVICQECGDWGARCSNCLEEMLAPVGKHQGASDRRIKVSEWKFESDIVEPRRWDGSDFCDCRGVGVITRRALDFFLKQNAFPFQAKPLFVDLAGATAEQRDRLEVARIALE